MNESMTVGALGCRDATQHCQAAEELAGVQLIDRTRGEQSAILQEAVYA